MDNMKLSQLEILQCSLSSFTDCALISSDVNRRYFTGMKSSAGSLLVFEDKSYLIIDFRYIEKARKTVKNCEVVLQDKLYDQIIELMKKHNAKKLSVEAENVTISQLETLKKRLDCEIDSSCELSEAIKSVRVCKRDDEIENIIKAQRIAEKGYEYMLDFVREGKTEREIQLELDFFMLKNGAEALSFDTIALSGKNTSLPHGVPTDKKVEKGEVVLLDFGAVVNGWHSDMTRTFCVGEPDDKMVKIYNIVLDAQMKALSAVKSGISGDELDKIARDVINDAGYGEFFGHSLGHGVGMEIHEAPTASPSCKNILENGMIVTVEPGIYLPDEFGVRIEDFVVVTDDGCKNLTLSPKKLLCV